MAKTDAQRQADARARRRAERDASDPQPQSTGPSKLAQATALAADMDVAELLQLASVVTIFVTSRRDFRDVTDRHDPDPGSPSRAGIPDSSSASKSSSSQGNSSTSPLRSSSSESRASVTEIVTNRDGHDRDVTASRSREESGDDESEIGKCDGHPLATKAMGAYMRALKSKSASYERNEGDRPHFETIGLLASKAADPIAQLTEWATRYVAERTSRSPKFFAEWCGRYAQSGPRVHGRLEPAADPGGCDDSDIEPAPRRRAHA